MKLYRDCIGWPLFQLHTATPRRHRPQRLLSAATESRGRARTIRCLNESRPRHNGRRMLSKMYIQAWVGVASSEFERAAK